MKQKLPQRKESDTVYYIHASDSKPLNDLFITDLHLTEASDTEYRWRVFDFAEQFMREYELDRLQILGDVFDRKDRHTSRLVNRLVDRLASFKQVIVLKGNHDYKKEDEPFLDFLNKINNVLFIKEPMWLGKDLYLPHTADAMTTWSRKELHRAQRIFMHQSVIGAVVSNYNEMREGLDLDIFTGCEAQIFSGDIHVPQVVSRKGVDVTYIGTQHPVSFGDVYEPRCMMIQQDEVTFLPIKTTKRPHIQIASMEELELVTKRDKLGSDDQAIITFWLEPEEIDSWRELKKQVSAWGERTGVYVKDLRMKRSNDDEKTGTLPQGRASELILDPKQALVNYARRERLPKEIIDIGQELLNEHLRTQ